MPRATVIRTAVTVAILGCLAFAGRWLWTTPLAPIPSRAAIGKLNLEQKGAELAVRFVPPKSLSSITLLLSKPIAGSEVHCAHPDFPLSVRVRVTAVGGTNVINDIVMRDRMQWTSWHNGPSVLLMLDGWLSQYLDEEREYELALSVESSISDLGEAGVFLHWMDRGYVWGRERQELRLSPRASK